MKVLSILMGAALVAASLIIFNTGLNIDSTARFFYFLFAPVAFVIGAALLVMEDD